jgi:hypothetical protein
MSARAKTKLYMHEALQQRTIKTKIITGEMKFSVWYQHKRKNLPTQCALDGVLNIL